MRAYADPPMTLGDVAVAVVVAVVGGLLIAHFVLAGLP